MKSIKFLAVALFTCISLYATAAVTAKVNIQVKGTLADDILIIQDDAVDANFADPNNGPKSWNSTNSWCLNIYALNGTDKLGAVVNPDINGLQLEFKPTANESNYTMSFSDVIGEITLSNTDTSFVIDPSKDYEFEATGGNVVAFTITMAKSYKRTANIGSYGTICLPYAIKSIEGGALYQIEGKDASNIYAHLVSLSDSSAIAGRPYFFNATATTVIFKYKEEGTAAPAALFNGLQGYIGEDDLDVDEGAYILLSNGFNECGLGNTLASNRAYIPNLENVPVVQSQAPGRRIALGIQQSQTPTELEAIEAANADGKMFINGQLIIVKDGIRYNAQGAKL